MARGIAVFSILFLLAGLARHVAWFEAERANAYEAGYYAPASGWLPVLSLGHREALADLFWCRALVYQGEELRHRGSLIHVFRYAEAIETLDPDFRALYSWIATAGTYRPTEVSRDDVMRSVAFLERGRARFPDDGQLAWILGATLSFELPPLVPADEREDARLAGLEHLMDAVRLGGAPEWVVLSNTAMLSRLGRSERAAEHLEEMYATVSDEAIRSEIALRIEQVRSDAYGEAFSDANDRFEFERVRTYSYMSPSLYFLVAPSAEERAPRGHYAAGLIDSLSLELGDEHE